MSLRVSAQIDGRGAVRIRDWRQGVNIVLMIRHLTIAARRARYRLIQRILFHRILYRNPTLDCHPSVIWDYAYKAPDSIRVGRNVCIRAFCEIVVYQHTEHSSIEGRLELGDGSVLSTGVNIRAAGGSIVIGPRTAISQHCVLVAANHTIAPGRPYLHSKWDESKTGVEIGENVWVGANCVLLPGASVGDNSVIAAGSVVNTTIPANEIWGGVPARKIRDVS
jgi:acetyltransferase-like isoleucine patch superfamily enzyme